MRVEAHVFASKAIPGKMIVNITNEDIAKEAFYSESAVVGCIVGPVPKSTVIDNFIDAKLGC